MGFKVFGAETLTAADVNNYLMRQVVPRVANTTDQNAIPSPAIGMKCFRTDTGFVMRHDGTTWKLWEGVANVTPVCAAISGTITSYTATGRYVIAAGWVTFSFSITITNKGTGAASLIINVPVASVASLLGVGVGKETQLSGDSLLGSLANTSQTVWNKYNNATAIITGAVLKGTICYEAA